MKIKNEKKKKIGRLESEEKSAHVGHKRISVSNYSN